MFKKLEEKLLRKLIHRKLQERYHWQAQRTIMYYALEQDVKRFPEDTKPNHLGSWSEASKVSLEKVY